MFWIFFEKFCEFFSKEFTAEKFLWNLTLEKFSIFYQSLRDYNCGSNRCMVTYRVPKRISWTERTFWEKFFVADCISGHFMKIWILPIFAIFFHQFQQMLVVGLLRCRWMIWRPKMVILNVWVQFNLYLNHFDKLERNISSKRLCRHVANLPPNVKNRVHPLNTTIKGISKFGVTLRTSFWYNFKML